MTEPESTPPSGEKQPVRPAWFARWVGPWTLDRIGWFRCYVTTDGTYRNHYGPSASGSPEGGTT